jgi:hypothetical protein
MKFYGSKIWLRERPSFFYMARFAKGLVGVNARDREFTAGAGGESIELFAAHRGRESLQSFWE